MRSFLDAVRLHVERFHPQELAGEDSHAAHSRARTLALLETQQPCDRRQFAPGHLTASAIVLSPDHRQILLVHHKRLNRWLQPGGHIEADDPSPEDAARRETIEETGVDIDSNTAASLTGVDVHEIPAARGEPTHLHHDLLWRFVAASEGIRVSSESNAVTWAGIDELDRYDLDAPLLANIARAIKSR